MTTCALAVLAMAALPARAASLAMTADCARAEPARPAPEFAWTLLNDTPAPDARVPYRIAIWGDSLTSARNFMDAALLASKMPKETVAPSFIQAGMNVSGLSLPLKSYCASKGWRVGYAHKEKKAGATYSKGMLDMTSDTPGDVVYLDFRHPQPTSRIKQLDILIEKAKPDASLLLGVSIDGGTETLVSLSRLDGSVLRITPDQPVATVRLRLVAGQVTLHGFMPVYQDAPATILDAFSVPGGLLRSWSFVGDRYFPRTPGPRDDYDLVLLQYGTNEGAAPSFDRAQYADYLRTNLRLMRKAYPHARCILIGPPDRGVVGQTWAAAALKYAAVHRQIALAQAQVGAEFECRAWDWQTAMGGPGTAAQWARANPPLMQPDLTHLTAKGYEISGHMFGTVFPLGKR